MRIVPWAPPASSAPAQAAAGHRRPRRPTSRAGAAESGRSTSAWRRWPTCRASRAARWPRRSFSQRPEASEHGRRRGGCRLACRRCRRHRQALPGPRSRHGEHGRRARDDQAYPAEAPGRRPAAVRSRDSRGRAARNGVARALHRPRPGTASRRSPAPIIEGLLRDRLGFRGVVITDSMEAAASLATGERHGHVGARGAGRRGSRAVDRPRLVPARLPTSARGGASLGLVSGAVRQAAARVLALKAGL